MSEPVNQPGEPPRPTHLLAALVRREGRIRVSEREIAEARDGKLGMSRTEAGDLVVTWVKAE
jgi:hypothetical protein